MVIRFQFLVPRACRMKMQSIGVEHDLRVFMHICLHVSVDRTVSGPALKSELGRQWAQSSRQYPSLFLVHSRRALSASAPRVASDLGSSVGSRSRARGSSSSVLARSLVPRLYDIPRDIRRKRRHSQ